MAETNRMSVHLPKVKFELISKENEEFDRVKIWAFACGPNRNFSYVSKAELDKAVDSLNYLPVVGHLIEDYDEDGKVVGYHFGGHDCVVTDDLEVKMVTVPYGVVIDNTAKYEVVNEYGVDVNYITVDAYLWTGRYPAMKEAIYSDDTWFSESAELTFKQYRPWSENALYTELLDINFSALCILGKSDEEEKNTEPCFISAKIEPVHGGEFSLNGEQFSQLMNEMKEKLSSSFEHTGGSTPENNIQKGGSVLTQEERNAILAKFSLTEEDINFEVTEEMTAEEFTSKLEEMSVQAISAASADEAEEPEVSPDAVNDDSTSAGFEGEPAEVTSEATAEESASVSFSMTYREKEESLREAISSLCQAGSDRECYCWLCDFDDEFVFYEMCIWIEDSYKEKRFKRGYSMAEDGSVTLASDSVEIFLKWLTQEEIDKLKNDEQELAELRDFKENAEASAYTSDVEELLDSFSDVSSLEEFASIKEEMKNSTRDQLESFETRLFALRGKQVRIEKKPQQNSLKLGIDSDANIEDDGYSGLITRARSRR